MVTHQAPKITVGRTVHFYQAGDQITIPCAVGQPLGAKVCEVIDAGAKVNLCVFDRYGNTHSVPGVRFLERDTLHSEALWAMFLPRLGE